MERARRGRPIKAGATGKSAVFSTRITPELRAALERAAKESGGSLSDEIETRLRRSFQLEDDVRRIFAAFGGDQNYAVLRLFAEVMRRLDTATGRRWTEDRWTFDQLEQAIGYLLREWRPDGAPRKPAAVPRFTSEEADQLGTYMARNVLAQLDFTEPEATDPFARIKANLGKLANRGGRT